MKKMMLFEFDTVEDNKPRETLDNCVDQMCLKQVSIKKINPKKITVGYLSVEELEEYNSFLEFSDTTIAECNARGYSLRNSMDVYEEYSFGLINILDITNVLGQRDRLGYYVKKNLFLVVDIQDADKSTKEIFEYAIHRFKKGNITLEKVMYSFFERIIFKDNKALEAFDFKMNGMEDELNKGVQGKQFNKELMTMKKKLLLLRNYYEQLIDIGEQLQENSNDIFAEEQLRYFKIFTDKVLRLSSNVANLHEMLVQLREAYQASLDYNLNRIMKVFTVVTTIFLPLTLIVGWYGMNFTTMPELTWKYGYIYVIALSILVIVFCIIFFKRKKLL